MIAMIPPESSPLSIFRGALSDNNSLCLFSFEIKKSIIKAGYSESFLQALSNSSWAHEGCLVAADIKQDDKLMSQLGGLMSCLFRF
jgi:hypothetical protein